MATEDPLNAAARDSLNAAVARVIRERRRKREMTREQVYTKADLPRATYDRIEKGETLPDVGRLESIACALDTTAVGIINEAKRSLDETAAPNSSVAPSGSLDRREKASVRAARIYSGMIGLE
ncbi:helix-turn-helix domain-containing protein [Nocardia sp. NPDC052566]|uniref:helix-turn-helix domain-containing protein n=1 Tax=Nocardia sp. NPDC052566 TaxID=3364330 RepID=UPI0037C55363